MSQTFVLKSVVTLLQRIGLLLLFYSLYRLWFFSYNFNSFSTLSVYEIIIAFVYGLRFDLASIALLNLPFILLSLAPDIIITNRYYQKMLKIIFWLVNIPFLLINQADIEFINFTGRRLTQGIFQISKDVKTNVYDILLDYWLWDIALVVVFVLLWKLYPRYKQGRSASWPVAIVNRFVIIVLTVLAARGGLQLKPLNVVHAYEVGSEDQALLALNSTFTFLKSGKSNNFKPVYNLISEDQLQQFKQQRKFKLNAFKSTHKIKNIVFILLESFALEYTGRPNGYSGYTPFLDSLSEKSLYFKNGFANGRRSIEAIPSIFCSLPSMMTEAFISSPYQGNKLNCLTHELKKRGYATAFFHGAENGTMFFDSFTRRIGFDKYFGLNEYPNDDDFDGTWGIYDGPYFKFAKETLDLMSSPFMAVVFTLSSHHPYKVPAKFKDQFAKGSLEIHESIGYTDHSLEHFFEQIKDSKWYSETLFVITADHTQKSDQPEYKNELGKYRIPILLYHPDASVVKELQAVNSDRLVQHVDLMPTVLDILNIQSEKQSYFGRSILSAQGGEIINGNEHFFWWHNKDQFVFLQNGNITSKQVVSEWPFVTEDVARTNANSLSLRSYFNYFYTGLYRDSWFNAVNAKEK